MGGGPQFRSRRTEAAVASGYVARYLDMSTEEEEELAFGVARVAFELLRVGIEEKTVKSAVGRYAFGTLPFLRPLLAALAWGREKRERYCFLYDEVDANYRAGSRIRMLHAELKTLLN